MKIIYSLSNLMMKSTTLFKSLIGIFTLVLLIQVPLTGKGLKAQNATEENDLLVYKVDYNHLTLKNISFSNQPLVINSSIDDLKVEALSVMEEKVASKLNSHWAWSENTLETIDSFSPFLFRTKKSQSIDEVTVLLHVNEKGRLSGFDVVGEVDKGLKERLDYLFRKLPDCKPVPGYSSYAPEVFELVIRK